MASSSSSSYNSPCAACKFLRRKCMPGCIFAPYFPPEEPQKFANVHKIFGASNVTKLLNELLPHQREDAVNSLAYEAEARVRDPVYGCVGAISFLQRQVQRLQKELDDANTDLIRYACNSLPPQPSNSMVRPRVSNVGASFYNNNPPPPAAGGLPPPNYNYTSLPNWNAHNTTSGEGGGHHHGIYDDLRDL
ncbi:protein LATERAL ORGAN BOUNDARIES [Tripterygium wilfordii]|uniref:Protein LATERAL ORGAN BOUNDARIES n=1 Tax=Tripterygium wilfordii TaxID=458696 RepID=A0A7J7CAW4_TRIWF|nr:LOB domain-containing protein 25-like [Tripterygium wilfordii]KAF5730876.1 protein LATERAL ORGAN BOUNDARIES [Tripterygium wilfordii]